MKDLRQRQEPIKILEENTGSNPFDLRDRNSLLDTPPKARETKAKMNYWDFVEIIRLVSGVWFPRGLAAAWKG